MTVRILFFARAKELAGTDCAVLEIPTGARLSQVRQEVARRFPALAEFLPRCQWAVHDVLASDDTVIPAEATLAVLPPVSGGSSS
ncbi:MAG: MoaD/ThiS family protein [Gemmatales bacterium]|nr:MoaD/ThiS family protein [Gemmatales bacterium]